MAGSFATFRQDGLSSDLGYNVVLRDGLDRQFVFSRVHYRPFSKFYLSTYLTADLLDDPDVTTLLATVDYTPIKPVNLSTNFSRYSIEKYRDTQIYRSVIEPNQALILGDEVINLVYNRVSFNLSYRFWRRFYHYQSLEYKVRSQDNLESWSFIFGLRASGLLQNALSVDVRTVVRNNFQSDSWLLALDAEYELTPGMFAQLRTTYFDGRSIDRFTERGRTFDQAQDILLIGGRLFWLPAKEHHLSVHYDGVYEMGIEDSRNQGSLLIHTLMTRYGYYF